MMPTATDKLKQAWNENPIQVAMAAAVVLTAMGKFIDALSGIQGRRAFAKQVNLKAKGK
jgi:hypothetical protein